MDIIHFWFSNPKIWFNATKTDDIKVSTIYDNFINYNFNLKEPYELLAKIILHDQMSRHKFRNCNCWKKFILPAVAITKMGLEDNIDEILEPNELCFFLMPLRHSKNYDNLMLALKIYNKNIKNYTNLTSYSRKFYFHLIKEIGLMKNLYVIDHGVNPNSVPNAAIYYSVIDKKTWFSIPKNIYKITMEKNPILDSIREFIVTNKITKLCVSLSGGVDSMLVLCSMITLKYEGYIEVLEAVHINYANRYLAWFEREFVIRFCKYHKIKLYVRDITEIYRTHKFRSVYEDVTKLIRYDLYKLIGLPIFLGHNKTDCLENLITNIKKQTKYNNLYNMYPIKKINDVIICRPLLDFDKKLIESINGFFHTKNSTYSWTERWKIRNVFIKNSDPQFIIGLENIKLMLEDTYAIIEKTAEDLTRNIDWDNIQIKDYKGPFEFEIWKKIIKFICYSLHIETPTNKSIENFLKIKENTKVSLTQSIFCKLNDDVISFEIIE